MTIISPSFDLNKVEWRHITDPDCEEFNVDFEYSLLGYNIPNGRLDMLLRYGNLGHCRRHRHVASTMTMVLEGEQHLAEWQPDGSKKSVHRKKGDYALAGSDALPHDEWGGEQGGTILLSMHAPDGILIEYFDETMSNSWTLSVEQYAKSWETGSVYGAKSY